ncbi:MAG: sel1 repeat family protein, partial [Bacteroidales bacterium]|nr:sel1 repeat family protein [Bacteroidales bacterium]
MNSKKEKETALRNKTQQEIKCKSQSDNENVCSSDFEINNIISFGDKAEARAYLKKHFKFDVFADETELLECLKGFAKQGDPIMQNLLGVCLCAGYGCEENPRKAIQWWTKAA